MQHNVGFRKTVKEMFKVDIKNNYLPNQPYINRLINSLDRVEANSYNQSHVGFISEYSYLEGEGVLQPIKEFVVGCLNQLLWVNSILESGKYAETIEDLEEEFDYKTPTMLGNPWTLNKVTKKGVFFHGDEPYQDSQVIINSENIIEITIALSKVVQKYTAKKNEQANSVVILDPKANDSALFISKEQETKCLKVLKDIKHPVLDVDGNFIDKHGMKAAIVVWYDKCVFLHFITKIPNNRKEVAKEVMEIIPNLKIDGSSFDKTGKAKKYKNEIELKLSQISSK